MTEQWRDIPGYENRYQASNLGRIRSVMRKNVKVLKPYKDSAGRAIVSLAKSGGKRRPFLSHRGVLAAFVGPCPEGMECCHNNGDPWDNRLENLRWDTRKANKLDSIRHGTVARNNCEAFYGTANKSSKLTDCDVRRIREAKKFGARNVDLYKLYGINRASMDALLRRDTWVFISDY